MHEIDSAEGKWQFIKERKRKRKEIEKKFFFIEPI